MGCMKCIAIFTVFVALASMYYYVPVPDEFSKPMPVRITMGILEIVQDLVSRLGNEYCYVSKLGITITNIVFRQLK